MKHLGRKIYLDFGSHIIAIERYAKDALIPQDVNLTPVHQLKTEYGHPLNGGKVISIYDIQEIMGEKQERFVGHPVHQFYGRDVNYYISDGLCWVTEKEYESMQRES